MASTHRLPRPDALFAIRAGELIAAGDTEQAVELCRRGLVYYPDNPGGYTMLASAYLSAGERERARLVLWDGFRRTGAGTLQSFAERIERAEPDRGGVGSVEMAEPASIEREPHAPAVDASAGTTPSSAAEDESDQPASLPEQSPAPTGVLALHVGRQGFGARSSNLRVIPGLEFAPLRHGDQSGRHSIAPLMNERIPDDELPFPVSNGDSNATPPPFPTPRVTGQSDTPLDHDGHRGATDPQEGATAAFPRIPGRIHEMVRGGETLTPLEELARRLESARIPSVDDNEQPTVSEPSIVSDTIALILVKQGAYAEALKAYQTLARTRPEKLTIYQEKIDELKDLLAEPGSDERIEQPE